jgi:hypothetical protein
MQLLSKVYSAQFHTEFASRFPAVRLVDVLPQIPLALYTELTK